MIKIAEKTGAEKEDRNDNRRYR